MFIDQGVSKPDGYCIDCYSNRVDNKAYKHGWRDSIRPLERVVIFLALMTLAVRKEAARCRDDVGSIVGGSVEDSSVGVSVAYVWYELRETVYL